MGFFYEVSVVEKPGMDASRFGKRLLELREAAGLTQAELAARSGLEQNSISRWERGRREPGWSAVVALADALGVSCEVFRKRPRRARGEEG